jgi:nitrogen fixation/metabolism regulation signal transduction histidine kinase
MDSITERDLHLHVQILGWLRIAGAALMLVIGVFLLIFLAGLGVFSSAAAEDATPFWVLTLVAFFVGGLMVVLALPGLLAGIGLLRRKEWGRILALIVAVFDLLNFPIGTLIAIYSFFVLFQSSATPYFAGTTTSLTTTNA